MGGWGGERVGTGWGRGGIGQEEEGGKEWGTGAARKGEESRSGQNHGSRGGSTAGPAPPVSRASNTGGLQQQATLLGAAGVERRGGG